MTSSPPGGDPATLTFYAENADAYAARDIGERHFKAVEVFTARLAPGACVLDLGCGGGWASERLAQMGFDVHAVDGCAEFAALTSKRIPRPARVLAFEDLDYESAFDGVFASATLHHVPKRALPDVLKRVAAALKPGGVLYASFKQGSGEARDTLGRFYAYYEADELQSLINQTPGLAFESAVVRDGMSYTGEPAPILSIFATKTPA